MSDAAAPPSPLPSPPPSRSTGADARAGVPADGPGRQPRSTGAALDSISDGFIVLDDEWRFTFVNAAAERFMRTARGQVLGRTLWEVFPDADSRRFGAEYRRALKDNVQVEFEEYYPEPLNAWFEVRAYPSPDGLSIVFRDITERRRIEEALRQSEERYRSLFDSLAQGFALFEIIVDERGAPRESRFLEVNPAFERMTGLTREDVVGKRGRDVFPAEYEQWATVYGSVVESGRPITLRHSMAGRDRHFEVFAFRPTPRQFAVLFHDVTDHLELQEALRINLTKYQTLFDSLPIGVSITDAEGRVREVNRTASRVLGTSAAKVVGQQVGKPIWRVIHPDGTPVTPEDLPSVRALKGQCTVEGAEMGIARPGEDVIWVSVSAAPIPLDGYGVVITYNDISLRRQAEAKLEAAHRELLAANARLEASMEALPIGLSIVDAAGGIVRSNAAFERLWGQRRPATHSVADYHQYKARWVNTGRDLLPEEWASSRVLSSGEAVVGQLIEIESFDGGSTFVLNSAAPILDERGAIAGCAVAVQDISRLVETERSLSRIEEDLRDANAHLAVANAALRRSNQTLEARVDARTQDLTRRTAQLQALALDLTRAEERERQRVAEVIHDHLQQLLSVARIKLGMVLEQNTARSVQKILTGLDSLLVESLQLTRSLAAELSPPILRRSGLAAALRWLGRWYHGRFGLQVAVDIESEVEPDEDTRLTLFRAARELLFNVVKHAKTPKARVHLSRTADGRTRIVVSDEGAGFEPETLRAQEGSGGGLGLFSLRERLDVLGGQFEVHSSPGRGTSITVSGPPPASATPGSPSPVAPLKPPASRRPAQRSRRSAKPRER